MVPALTTIMSSSNPSRQPAGVPTGGQFAARSSAEAEISLEAPRPVTAEPEVTSDGQYTTVRGSKYTGWRDAAAIAKDVRSDIKSAVASGDLPASIGGHDIAYSVTCKKYSGGQSISVAVQGMADADIYGERDQHGYRRHSEKTQALVRKLKGIAGAYDKSTTDIQTDYFNVTYYCHVDIEDERAARFRLYEKSTVALRSEYHRASKEGADTLKLREIRDRSKAVKSAYDAGSRADNERNERERREWLAQQEGRW